MVNISPLVIALLIIVAGVIVLRLARNSQLVASKWRKSILVVSVLLLGIIATYFLRWAIYSGYTNEFVIVETDTGEVVANSVATYTVWKDDMLGHGQHQTLCGVVFSDGSGRVVLPFDPNQLGHVSLDFWAPRYGLYMIAFSSGAVTARTAWRGRKFESVGYEGNSIALERVDQTPEIWKEALEFSESVEPTCSAWFSLSSAAEAQLRRLRQLLAEEAANVQRASDTRVKI